MSQSNPPTILDCTLRDGAYIVDFQFTSEDTQRIAKRLDDLGIPLIEVGHGVGLGASENGLGNSAATDTEYMSAAAKAVTRGKWGMFCIPGIAKLSDIEIASDHGIGFIRIGTEVNKVESGKTFIETALRRGIQVYCNLMKSYVATPEYFAIQANKCYQYGASVVYIVDSAGGMLPKEIEKYVDAVRSIHPQAALGFHGHNNLGLAVANSLHCADLGASIIDTALQGLGRSAGNTPTSQFIATLMRSGYKLNYDVVDVMQAGEELTRHLIRKTGYDTLDMTAGLALFHSGYMKQVVMTAESYGVDPRRLIIALCERDRVNAPQELINEAAQSVLEIHGKQRSNGDYSPAHQSL